VEAVPRAEHVKQDSLGLRSSIRRSTRTIQERVLDEHSVPAQEDGQCYPSGSGHVEILLPTSKEKVMAQTVRQILEDALQKIRSEHGIQISNIRVDWIPQRALGSEDLPELAEILIDAEAVR